MLGVWHACIYVSAVGAFVRQMMTPTNRRIARIISLHFVIRRFAHQKSSKSNPTIRCRFFPLLLLAVTDKKLCIIVIVLDFLGFFVVLIRFLFRCYHHRRFHRDRNSQKRRRRCDADHHFRCLKYNFHEHQLDVLYSYRIHTWMCSLNVTVISLKYPHGNSTRWLL